MLDIREIWLETVKEIDGPGSSIALVFQPITKGIISKSLEHGENSLDLKVSDGPLVVCLLNTVHGSPESDTKVSVAMLDLIKKIEELVAERGLDSRYKFLNYGYKGQKILEGYGEEKIRKLKAASKKYDPAGFFQAVVPGWFKISNVNY
jgi:hypothetical protein